VGAAKAPPEHGPWSVLTLAALAVVILSGMVLAIFGPTWWHVSSTGLFVNSLHLWSVEVFFFAMVVHLWGKFFMATWRDRRRATWITGVVSFVVSVGAAFTGYLSQQNFDSQWISTQAKDGINSTGAGAIFNVTNFGQMLMWHIMLLPLVIVVLVGAHVLLVRRRGVVPPFAPPDRLTGRWHGTWRCRGEGDARVRAMSSPQQLTVQLGISHVRIMPPTASQGM
jgi:hypothetical protein